MQERRHSTDSRPSEVSSGHRALQALAVLIIFTSFTLNEWMGSTVFPMAEGSLRQHLGEDYLRRLPEVSQWVLNFWHSHWAWVGTLLPWIALGAVLLGRSSGMVAATSALVLAWVVALSILPLFAFWMADKMIVHALATSARSKDHPAQVLPAEALRPGETSKQKPSVTK